MNISKCIKVPVKWLLNRISTVDFFAYFFQIEPGWNYLVSIIPTEYFAAPSLRELDETARDCRFTDENPAESMFNFYTQKGCELECKVNYVSGEDFYNIRWSIRLISDQEAWLLPPLVFRVRGRLDAALSREVPRLADGERRAGGSEPRL